VLEIVGRWLSQLGNGDWIALISLAVTTIALAVAVQAIRRGSRHTSAATLVTINEAFRDGWQRFLTADESRQEYEFSELLNTIEISCAIYLEKSLTGNSRKILAEYLENIILLLEQNAKSRERIQKAIHSPSTFTFIAQFRRQRRKASQNPLVTGARG
jgi:hypothetical protein